MSKNVIAVSHSGTGKTTLGDAILFLTGAVSRKGSVDSKSSNLDYDNEEKNRGVTIGTKFAKLEWKKETVNYIDTPGYEDFIADVLYAAVSAENALVLVSAPNGVEVHTEIKWQFLDEMKKPRIVLINKMDKERADFDASIKSCKDLLDKKVYPVQLPIGKEADFKGVVDLIEMKAYYFAEEGKKVEEGEIPADLREKAEELRAELIEEVASVSEDLMEKFFEEETLSTEEIKEGLKKALKTCAIYPALVCSATTGAGISTLLDFIVEYGVDSSEYSLSFVDKDGKEVEPTSDLIGYVAKTVADPFTGKINYIRIFKGSIKKGDTIYDVNRNAEDTISHIYVPVGKELKEVEEVKEGDFAALVKLKGPKTGDTIARSGEIARIVLPEMPTPVYTVALVVTGKGADEKKLRESLEKLSEEDPSFTYQMNVEVDQLHLTAMGDSQVNVIISKLKNRYKVETAVEKPRIPYRETITKKAEDSYKHKKQTGGRGQYGEVFLRLEPLPRNAGFEFVDEIVGGVIPRQYIPSVEKGIREAMQHGVFAGYPVMDVKATVFYGSYHPVDSSDLAFKIAASMAFKKTMEKAGPILLEPVMEVEIHVPDEFTGDIMSDLNSRRGKILGMERKKNYQIIKAHVPLAELLTYTADLKSMTQGRGFYLMKFYQYEPVPPNLAEKIKEETERLRKEEK